MSFLLSFGRDGLRHRGGVLHVSANSLLESEVGTSSPIRSLSVDPSSMPLPSHLPHGNLKTDKENKKRFNQVSHLKSKLKQIIMLIK